MADNYIENQYEDYLKQKAKKEEAKRVAWRKRLQAYKEKLAKEKSDDKRSQLFGYPIINALPTNSWQLPMMVPLVPYHGRHYASHQARFFSLVPILVALHQNSIRHALA